MIKNSFYILLAGCSYGILSTLAKLMYQRGYNLGDISGSQAFFGSIFLWAYLFISHKKKNTFSTKIEKFTIAKLLAAGVASGLVSITYYESTRLLPASISIIMLMQYTWISVLIERIFFKVRIQKKQFFCILLILTGTVLAAGLLNKEGSGGLTFWGIVYGLLAALFYATFIISNGRIANHYSSIKKSSIIAIGMCLIVFTILPPTFIWNGSLVGIAKWGIPLGIFGTVLPPVLFAIAIPKIGISLSSILTSIELPTAVALSYFVLQEHVSFVQVIGVLFILSSIVLANAKKKGLRKEIS